MKLINYLNQWVLHNLASVEMLGVLMRIASFSVVSWMGKDSPFLIIWLVNTIDAILLTWCALLKKDKAYTLLNLFWIGVGIMGMIKAYPITI